MKKLNILLDKENSAMQHISLKNALQLRLIERNAPVNKFFEHYMNTANDELSKKFKLVVYAGNEMIGPSVQVAELAGCIVGKMKDVDSQFMDPKTPFYFLDIFSGSSATTIPSAHKFVSRKDKFIKIVRIDGNRPDLNSDYLELLYQFDYNINHDCYDSMDVFEAIQNGTTNKLFDSRVTYDLCVADPPHYLTLNFLIGKSSAGGPCICDILKEKVKVFIIYYAHKEQKKLCEQVRKELSKYFPRVRRVIVGSEEMSVCYGTGTSDETITAGLEEFQALYHNRYDPEHKLDIDYDRVDGVDGQK